MRPGYLRPDRHAAPARQVAGPRRSVHRIGGKPLRTLRPDPGDPARACPARQPCQLRACPGLRHRPGPDRPGGNRRLPRAGHPALRLHPAVHPLRRGLGCGAGVAGNPPERSLERAALPGPAQGDLSPARADRAGIPGAAREHPPLSRTGARDRHPHIATDVPSAIHKNPNKIPEDIQMNDPQGFEAISRREQGLQRRLSAAQMSMIAIGGAIGTGLFMGSAFAIGFAGPSVLLSYAIGALITLLLMGCLAEMTVAHATPGSFGAFAEHYVGPLAGFLVRYAYWAAIVLAVGTEVTAVAMYMKYWFAGIPEWVWIISFSTLLIGLNASSVKAFGNFEYCFSTLKIAAIVAFILLGAYLVFGSANPAYGVHNYSAHGGFFPHGLKGMWIAVVVSIFSYLSVEMIAVAAAEAEHPEQAVKSAFRSTIVRLVVFYLLTLALMLAIVPWDQAGQSQSPFVTVMQAIGLPGATGVMNFVVLVAALSAMNSQLYITTRMMFSLSRAGHAPKGLGELSRQGVPLNALLLSSVGIALATLLNLVYPEQSFTLMMAVSMFGALFTWLMIFFTHLCFRRHRARHGGAPLAFRMRLAPWSTLLGLALMAAILVTTFFTEAFRMTLVFGVPFLALLSALYLVFVRKPGRDCPIERATP
ncbi:hypothetical protein P38_3122 [Pseudomonas aeruginosa MH38]|nr:hypothetical protein P38_3122 [Pseudomonas aeruginosa MH38]